MLDPYSPDRKHSFEIDPEKSFMEDLPQLPIPVRPAKKPSKYINRKTSLIGLLLLVLLGIGLCLGILINRERKSECAYSGTQSSILISVEDKAQQSVADAPLSTVVSTFVTQVAM